MNQPTDLSFLLQMSADCDQLAACADPDNATSIANRIADAIAQAQADLAFALDFANQALSYGVDDLGSPPHLDLLAERCNAHPQLRAAGLRFQARFGRLQRMK